MIHLGESAQIFPQQKKNTNNLEHNFYHNYNKVHVFGNMLFFLETTFVPSQDEHDL